MEAEQESVESPVITIDGSSGVGKGTVSLLIAQNLGWNILDSGSLYRLTALEAQLQSIAEDEIAKKLPHLLQIALNLDVDYRPEDGELQVYLDGDNVTDSIRTEEIGRYASRIAAIPEVRSALLDRQKAFAAPPGLVADGRDMGTTVFPDARLKIFLTASPEERANRRYKQLKDKGLDANLPRLIADLKDRDERDANRSASPLCAADDAVIIDTTHIGIEQVVDKVMDLISQRFDLSGG